MKKEEIRAILKGIQEAVDKLHSVVNGLVDVTQPEESPQEHIIPAEIAQTYRDTFLLRNVYGNTDQYMYIGETSRAFGIKTYQQWETIPSVKMVEAKSIEDIKPDDLVRYTDGVSWDAEEEEKDKGLRKVVRIDGDVIILQFWSAGGDCHCIHLHFSVWKHWQVSKKIKEGE